MDIDVDKISVQAVTENSTNQTEKETKVSTYITTTSFLRCLRFVQALPPRFGESNCLYWPELYNACWTYLKNWDSMEVLIDWIMQVFRRRGIPYEFALVKDLVNAISVDPGDDPFEPLDVFKTRYLGPTAAYNEFIPFVRVRYILNIHYTILTSLSTQPSGSNDEESQESDGSMSQGYDPAEDNEQISERSSVSPSMAAKGKTRAPERRTEEFKEKLYSLASGSSKSRRSIGGKGQRSPRSKKKKTLPPS